MLIKYEIKYSLFYLIQFLKDIEKHMVSILNQNLNKYFYNISIDKKIILGKEISENKKYNG